MANPASHFSLYDPSMDEGATDTPAQRVPDVNGGLAPMQTPNPLMEQAIRQIMSTLIQQPPKRTFLDRVSTPGIMVGASTRKERDYQRDQENARATLNSLTAMRNSENGVGLNAWRADQSARGWANLDARREGLTQAGQRIDLSARRLAWQQAGYEEQFDSEYDPQTNMNRNVVYAISRDPTTGQVVVRDKVYFGQEPIHYGAYEAAGGAMQQFPTSPNGRAGAPQPTPNPPPTTNRPVTTTPTAVPPAGSGGGQVGGQVGGGSPTGNILPPKQPPQGAAKDYQAQQSFRQSLNLNKILGLHARGQESIKKGLLGNFGWPGRVVSDFAAGREYARGLVGDPEVAFKQAIKWAVYQYVKAQTGAQFSIAEMDKYAGQFPTLADSPERARFMINSAILQATQKINLAKLQWAGLRAPGYTPDIQMFDDQEPPEMGMFGGESGIPRNIAKPEADGRTPESVYGGETTNVGTGDGGDDWDAEFDRLMEEKRNAPKR